MCHLFFLSFRKSTKYEQETKTSCIKSPKCKVYDADKADLSGSQIVKITLLFICKNWSMFLLSMVFLMVVQVK